MLEFIYAVQHQNVVNIDVKAVETNAHDAILVRIIDGVDWREHIYIQIDRLVKKNHFSNNVIVARVPGMCCTPAFRGRTARLNPSLV